MKYAISCKKSEMRASQKNNYDSHGNEVRWPPGCLFFPTKDTDVHESLLSTD